MIEQLRAPIVFTIQFFLLVVTMELVALDKLRGADTDRFECIFTRRGRKPNRHSDTPFDAHRLPAAAKV